MILDKFEWFPSTLPVTRCDRIKDERKRIKAFGGLGIYDASRRFPWLVARGGRMYKELSWSNDDEADWSGPESVRVG